MLTYVMDPESAPNCCICNKPAVRGQECSCEAERLELAVRQAEQRSMDKRLEEIRSVHTFVTVIIAFAPR